MNYVFPRFQNKVYKVLRNGVTFGHSDLHGQDNLIQESNRIVSNGKTTFDVHPLRRFTVQAQLYSELLQVQLEDLFIMKVEFHGVYGELMESAKRNFERDMKQKLECIKK